MKEKIDFERAVENFRSTAEDQWVKETTILEYLHDVWKSMTWGELISYILSIAFIFAMTFGTLLLG